MPIFDAFPFLQRVGPPLWTCWQALWCALVLAMPAHAAKVTLAWDANAEPDVAGYRLYYGNDPGLLTEALDVGSATSGTVHGLRPGATFYFGVCAYNSAGLESQPSEVIEYQTPSELRRRSFTGLIGEDQASVGAGAFKLTVGTAGTVSGRLLFGGKSFPIRGSFDANGELVTQVSAAGVSFGTLTIQLSAAGDAITGTFESEGVVAELAGREAIASAGRAFSGRYTVAISTDASAGGGGYGFGTLKVTATGLARLSATLPNGARFAAGVPIDAAGTAPFYVQNGRSGKLAFSRLAFRETENESDADGGIRWRDRANEGFGTIRAARYPALNPSAMSSWAPMFGALSVRIARPDHAEIIGNFPAPAMQSRSLITQSPAGDTISLRFSPATGVYAGVLTNAGSSKAHFGGVLFAKGIFRGYGLLKKGPGSVELSETAE